MLLVDDSAHRVALIRDELTRQGHEVVGVIDSALRIPCDPIDAALHQMQAALTAAGAAGAPSAPRQAGTARA